MKFIRRIYDWTLAWSESRFSAVALFFLAIIEASFFIIPPDLLLIALCAGKPKKAWFFALICAVGSLIGGLLGYMIGALFMDSIGRWIVETLQLNEAFELVRLKYEESAAMAIFAAAFTPIPYKVFTIAAGAFGISLSTFIISSAIGRSARFFIVAGCIFKWGPQVRDKIDKHFNLFTVIFTLLLLGGVLAIKMLR